jgi:hypothetical protein
MMGIPKPTGDAAMQEEGSARDPEKQERSAWPTARKHGKQALQVSTFAVVQFTQNS